MTDDQEARLWQLFMLLHDASSDYERRTGDFSVRFRVQKAHRILQEYEREIAGIRASNLCAAEIDGLLVTDLDLTVRVLNCLRSEEIRTVDQLCQYTRRSLAKIPNMGAKGIRQIEYELDRHGRKLKESSV